MDTTLVTNQEKHNDSSSATKDSIPISQVVTFHLANEHYGINIQNVQEIILVGQITSIPEVPSFVEGLINLRGKVIPVIDLRRRFELTAGEYGENTRIIVTNTSQRTIGLVVDEVHEVLRLDGDQIEALPEGLTNVDAAYITGVVKLEKRILILLDVEVVISDETQASIAQAEASTSDPSTRHRPYGMHANIGRETGCCGQQALRDRQAVSDVRAPSYSGPVKVFCMRA